MKTKIKTTYKTTVTFSAKEFLKRLGLERSGILEIVSVQPERLTVFGDADDKKIESTVDVSFHQVEEVRENEEE